MRKPKPQKTSILSLLQPYKLYFCSNEKEGAVKSLFFYKKVLMLYI